MVSVSEIVRDVVPTVSSTVEDIRAEALGTPPYEGGKPCGRVLRALREYVGIDNQEDFGDMLGYSWQAIARHEDGRTADPDFMNDPWVRQVLAVLLRRAGVQ